MYTIVMDKDKNLNTTVRGTIFKNENLVNKIQFLIPPQFDGNAGRVVIDPVTGEQTIDQDGVIDINDYIVTLKYVDPNGNFKGEVLEKDAETYKNYLRYTLPVDSKLTAVAGDITIRLTLTNFDPVTEVMNKLESNSTSIKVEKPKGFDDYINFEDIDAIKKQILDLKGAMPNDLAINEDDKIQLTHDGAPIGDGVEIYVPTQLDGYDGKNDGIVNVDDIDLDAYQYIEV